MGHQCIGQVFGGDVVRAPSGVMHGKTSPVHHKDSGLLKVCYMLACHVSKMLSAHRMLIRLIVYDLLQAPPCHTLLAVIMQASRLEAGAVACCSMSYDCLHHCSRLICAQPMHDLQEATHADNVLQSWQPVKNSATGTLHAVLRCAAESWICWLTLIILGHAGTVESLSGCSVPQLGHCKGQCA